MSADNWTTCPRCAAKAVKDQETREAKLEKSYGKIPVEKFLALRAEVEEYRDKEIGQTLREDYSLGINEGQFAVSYAASCTAPGCELSFEYNYEEDVPR